MNNPRCQVNKKCPTFLLTESLHIFLHSYVRIDYFWVYEVYELKGEGIQFKDGEPYLLVWHAMLFTWRWCILLTHNCVSMLSGHVYAKKELRTSCCY